MTFLKTILINLDQRQIRDLEHEIQTITEQLAEQKF